LEKQGPDSLARRILERTESVLGLVGLALLMILPLAYSTNTYERAYPKTFLFQTAGVVLFASLLLAVARRKVYGRRPFRGAFGLSLALVGWLAWCLASCLWARRPYLALERSCEVALMIFLALGAGYSLQSIRRRRAWLIACAVTLVPAAGYAIWVYAQPYEQRFIHLFSNRNLAGPFLYIPCAIAICASLSSWRNRAAWWRRVLLTALAVLWVVAIISTQSAAALVCLMIVLPAALFLTSKVRKHLLWAAPGALLVFALVVALTRTYTLKDLRTPLSQSTVGARVHFWGATLRMYAAHPRLGVGAGGYIAAIPSFRSPESMGHPLATPSLHQAHCFPLETLAELGPVGLLLVGWVIFCVLAQSFRTTRSAKGLDRALSRGVFAGFSAMVAHSFVGVGFSYTEVQAMFWLGASLVLAMAGLNSGSELTGWRRRLRPVPITGTCLLIACCWAVGSWNPLCAQIELSGGIKLQERANDPERPTRERQRDADAAAALFEKVRSRTFAGRAYVYSALHLAATLDSRATFLTPAPEQQREIWQRVLALQKRMLDEYPNYGVVRRTLAQIAYKLGDDPLAIRSAHEQAELNPWDRPSYETWLLAARRSGQDETLRDALRLVQKARSKREDSLDWLYLEAGVLVSLGEKELAADRFQQIERICRAKIAELHDEPTDPRALKYHLYLAKILAAEDKAEAKAHCQAVLDIRPGHPFALQLLRQLSARGP